MEPKVSDKLNLRSKKKYINYYCRNNELYNFIYHRKFLSILGSIIKKG